MAKIVDLGAMCAENLVIKTSTQKEFEISSDISIQFMTKLYKLQEDISDTKNNTLKQLETLQKFVYCIIGMNQPDTFTFEEFTKEPDFCKVKMLSNITKIFWDFMNTETEKALPKDDKKAPNAKSPKVK